MLCQILIVGGIKNGHVTHIVAQSILHIHCVSGRLHERIHWRNNADCTQLLLASGKTFYYFAKLMVKVKRVGILVGIAKWPQNTSKYL